MVTSNPKGVLATSNLPRAFPIWPGVCIGLAVTFGLVGSEVLEKTPRPLIGLIGGVMTVAHGMVAFAVVTLLGESLTVAGWERTLVERLGQLPRLSDPDPLLDETVNPQTARDEIELNVRALAVPWRETRRIIQVVAYIVPLIGFAVAIWNPGKGASWVIAGRPLLLTLGEAFFLILLSLGVSNSLEVVKSGWLLLAPNAKAQGPRDDLAVDIQEWPQR